MSSQYKHVFTPITIKGLTYKNRLEVSPPVPGFGAMDGTITPDWRLIGSTMLAAARRC